MNFQLSEDQRAFADTARALFADHCSDEAQRAHDIGTASFHQALWPACIEMGLHSIVVPEAAGGMGQGMTELMAVLETQGRALALVPLWEQQLATATLAQFADAALLGPLLPALVEGRALITPSLAPLADARGAALQAVQAGDGWHLRGRVAALPLGAQAAFALVGASCNGTPRLLLLDLSAPGLQRVAGRSQHHLAVCDLIVDGVELPPHAVLPQAALPWFEARAMACLASLQMGVSAEQLRRTVEYVSQRQQFGRAVGSFQLVTGQMADGHIAVEALRSALWQLVYRLDAGLDATPQALSARALACDAAHRVGHMAQHVHGGIGVDLSYPMHRFLFWSRALAATLGGLEATLAGLGDWLAEHDELGWKYDLPEPARLHAPSTAQDSA